LSLKGGLCLRHLEQNKYIFQINVQRLESVRQGKKQWGVCLLKKPALLMVPFVFQSILHMLRPSDFIGGSMSMEFKRIKVPESRISTPEFKL